MAFKDNQTLLYLFWLILKHYAGENHYTNFGYLMNSIGSFFEQGGEYSRAQVFYFNALQWAMAQKDLEVG